MLVTQDRFETLLLCHAMVTILIHFGAPHGRPHNPSITGSDSCPLSNVHLIQKWIMLVTQDRFETFMLCHAMSFWSILVHLMGDPTTPLQLVLTPVLFQVSI